MNLDFKTICRICLKPTKGSIDLFPKNGVRDLSKEDTEKIIEKFEKCYNVQISPDDGLPTKVCHKCIQIVSFFYISMQNAAHSQQFLKNSLLLKQLAEKDSEENHNGNSIEAEKNIVVVENSSSSEICPPNLEIQHEHPVNVNHVGSREELVNSDEKPPDDVNQGNCDVNNDSTENQTLKPSSKPVLNENNNELDIQLNKSSDKSLQEEKENNINHLKQSKVSNTPKDVETENLKKKESVYDFDDEDDDDEDDNKPLLLIKAETEKSKEINKSYLKLKKNNSNVAINQNCTNNQVSHNLASNAKVKNPYHSTDKLTSHVLKSEKKLRKVKKLDQSKKKNLRSREDEKKDKLKEYYEKLLTTDNSLKVEYCRITSQKAKLNIKMAAEKKCTHDLNLKIYNLVRVTVDIVNVLSGMKASSEKEKMEKVFDRLISGDGVFENFAKQKQDMNDIQEGTVGTVATNEDSDNKKEEKNKCEIPGKPEKSDAQKFADSLHENMKSKWNNLLLKVPDKDNNSDSSTDKIGLRKEIPKTQSETAKETQKTLPEKTKEIQEHHTETPKETQKLQVDPQKVQVALQKLQVVTQKLQIKTLKETPKQQEETSKATSKPLVETPKESQEALKDAKKRTPKEIKVIGTDLDLDNILPYDAKRRRTTVLDNLEASSSTPTKSEKKPTNLDTSRSSNCTPKKDYRDSSSSSSETSPDSKTPLLKMKKLQGLKVGNKLGDNDKKLKLMKSLKYKQKNK